MIDNTKDLLQVIQKYENNLMQQKDIAAFGRLEINDFNLKKEKIVCYDYEEALRLLFVVSNNEGINMMKIKDFSNSTELLWKNISFADNKHPLITCFCKFLNRKDKKSVIILVSTLRHCTSKKLILKANFFDCENGKNIGDTQVTISQIPISKVPKIYASSVNYQSIECFEEDEDIIGLIFVENNYIFFSISLTDYKIVLAKTKIFPSPTNASLNKLLKITDWNDLHKHTYYFLSYATENYFILNTSTGNYYSIGKEIYAFAEKRNILLCHFDEVINGGTLFFISDTEAFHFQWNCDCAKILF